MGTATALLPRGMGLMRPRSVVSVAFLAFVGFASVPGCLWESSSDGDSPRTFPAADAGSEEGSNQPFDTGGDSPADAGFDDTTGPDRSGDSGKIVNSEAGRDTGTRCANEEKKCGGTCVDLSSNADHCGSCGRSCGGGGTCTDGYCAPTQETAATIAATNDVRSTETNCGGEGTFSSAPPLEGNTHLHEAAQRHADDMVANDFFSHTGSDGSQFQDRVRETAFSGRPVAENIAGGNRSAEQTVRQWKNSDGHCRNMMKSGATHIGIGIAMGGEYGVYWVQVFGAK